MKIKNTNSLRTSLMGAALIAFSLLGTGLLSAQTLLTTGSITSSSTSMIDSTGSVWTGGAVGVQGSGSAAIGGVSVNAANSLLKFSIGSLADSYNALYGAGNWTITNVTLSFQYTLYANNSRFGAGAGTFATYWVGADGVTAYSASESELSSWSSDFSNLATTYYDWTTPSYTGTLDDLGTSVWATDKSGSRQSILSINLAETTALLDEFLTASASGDAYLSLYLMSLSDSLGLTIFATGGTSVPTLTFDVVSTPEPSSSALVLVAVILGALGRRGAKNRKSTEGSLDF